MIPIRRFKIGNLVRDQMPERIQKLGGFVEMHQLDPEDHIRYLKLKLKEETEEVCQADNPKELKEEIADVLEVLHTLSKKFALRWEDVEKERLQKRDNRGGFKKGTFIKYVQVESNDNHPVIQYCLKNPEKYSEIFDLKS